MPNFEKKREAPNLEEVKTVFEKLLGGAEFNEIEKKKMKKDYFFSELSWKREKKK
ncbi:MAG: hypothetical protein R6V40_02700 [Candidatus Moraniibacteriota bacterium]